MVQSSHLNFLVMNIRTNVLEATTVTARTRRTITTATLPSPSLTFPCEGGNGLSIARTEGVKYE